MPNPTRSLLPFISRNVDTGRAGDRPKYVEEVDEEMGERTAVLSFESQSPCSCAFFWSQSASVVISTVSLCEASAELRVSRRVEEGGGSRERWDGVEGEGCGRT